MGTDPKFKPPGGLLIIDHAFYLLRRGATKLLPAYYIGSLPFVLGLLFFWTDMSRSADAHHHLGLSSLGVAVLYIWMKCWQSVFAIRTRDLLLGREAGNHDKIDLSNLIATQTILQSASFIILPIASVLALPFGWCYAFFQNVTAAPPDHGKSLKTVWQFAWQQAKLWPRQNHIILAIMSIFSLAVLINLALAVFMFPYLIKKFLGTETIFTLSGINALNTTFWAVVFALTYLCLDPIIKTAYTLRCYYGESLKSGTDIKTELSQCVSQQL